VKSKKELFIDSGSEKYGLTEDRASLRQQHYYGTGLILKEKKHLKNKIKSHKIWKILQFATKHVLTF